MSKNNGPVTSLWNGALLFFGAVIVIALSLSVLAQIWGWILLVAGIVGLVAGAVLVMKRLSQNSSSRW